MDVQIGKYKMGDFGLKLLGVDLGTPSVRKSTVTIPGRNGALDLTEAITGFPVYDNATHKLTFDFKDGTYSTCCQKPVTSAGNCTAGGSRSSSGMTAIITMPG